MPRTLLRLLLIWIIAFALPVQGAVAATMVYCDAGHARGDASGLEHVHGPSPVGAVVNTGEDLSTLHATTATYADRHHHADTHDDAHQSGCGACPPCCSPAALSSFPSLPAVVRSTAPVADRTVPYAPVFLTGGPERPPRPFLA